MVSTALHLDQRVIDRARVVLAAMDEMGSSLVYATLLTDDGFEIAHSPERDGSDSRFASMASSMQALSEAVARELKIGASEYVIVTAENGHVIQRRVSGQPVVLAALYDDDETLGKALSVTRVTAESMSQLLASVLV